MTTTTTATPTAAERRVLAALSTAPRTPAEIKRAMPGETPVATIRALLASLRELGLAETAVSARTPGTTAWVYTAAGSPDGRRETSLRETADEWQAKAAVERETAVPGLNALVLFRARSAAHFYARPNDETRAHEGRLTALRNFSATANGEMSVEEFEEISSSIPASGPFAEAYRATIDALVAAVI